MSTHYLHVHLSRDTAIVVRLEHVGGYAQAAQFAAKLSGTLDAGESLILDADQQVFVIPADSVMFVRVTTDDEPAELGGV